VKFLLLTLIFSAQVLAQDLYTIMLRRPRTERPHEMRSDPFFCYGSFGLTGCHAKNILNNKRIESLEGRRVAFLQGGPKGGFRIVMITPPLKIKKHKFVNEITWDHNKAIPFKYEHAPVFMSQVDGKPVTNFPSIQGFVQDVNSQHWVSKAMSKFRTRSEALPEEIAREVYAVHENFERVAPAHYLALDYTETLPYLPNTIDHGRRANFNMHRWLADNFSGYYDGSGMNQVCRKLLISTFPK